MSKKSLFAALALCLVMVACSSDYGTKLQYKKGELYYTKNVTKAQAEKLGNYLMAQDFFDDSKRITVQLDQANDTMLFRLVVLDSFINKPEYERLFQTLIPGLSKDAFDGKPALIHFCDDHLKTIKVVSPLPLTSAAALRGTWLCTNLQGGSPADPLKTASDIETLKTNFTFSFYPDGRFQSDFANEDDVMHPKNIEGNYNTDLGRLNLTDLVINGTPSSTIIQFDLMLQNHRLRLVNHNAGKPDLTIDFKPVSE